MNIYVWSVIIGGCIVTVLPRVLPITVLSKLKLNNKIEVFLKYMPISILSALIAVELITENSSISISSHYAELLATIPTILIGIKKKNLLLTVTFGVILVACLRLII